MAWIVQSKYQVHKFFKVPNRLETATYNLFVGMKIVGTTLRN